MADLGADRAPFDGILLDIGVSSPQLDHPERGFSLRADGPLDMRMDPTSGESAADLLDHMDEASLTTILRDYGEEPRAKRIARAILAGRPWEGTLALADAVARASGYRNSRTHPATRTFQALRIAVNDELGQLKRGLDAAVDLLAPNGRLAVISFHSLEDRIVKQRFRTLAAVGTPRDAYGHPRTPARVRLITRKPIRGAQHDAHNPRSRSASLRIVERLG
jgi:16S rRNA (cytosine1402-N4)-methyltransferase